MNVCVVVIGGTWLQLNSFETQLPVPALVSEEGGPSSFRAVFIRAPAITEAGPSVEVLAEYTLPSNFQTSALDQVSNIFPFWNIAWQNVVDPKQFLKFAVGWYFFVFCHDIFTSTVGFLILIFLWVQVEGQEELQKVIVAVRQKNLMATAFHPELTSDMRW